MKCSEASIAGNKCMRVCRLDSYKKMIAFKYFKELKQRMSIASLSRLEVYKNHVRYNRSWRRVQIGHCTGQWVYIPQELMNSCRLVMILTSI